MQHNENFLELVTSVRGKIKELSIDDVKNKFAKKDKFVFIDVREDHEWDKGHLPYAVHMGRGIIERDIETAIADKNTEIVLYCGGGFRSALSAYNLQLMGYNNVYSMDGGFRDWKNAGYGVENDK